MKKDKSYKSLLISDEPWASLRSLTEARIGLGRSGSSQTTQTQLAFQLAHARARDAVHIPLDFAALQQQLALQALPFLRLHSQAIDRTEYLQRPDKGRRLDKTSIGLLKAQADDGLVYDASIVLVDGLSSSAVQQHGAVMVELIDEQLKSMGLRCSPLCLVEQGRVAIGDEVAEILASRLLILLIGERPGLSSPDSLGIYYTYQARVGLTDESRNCISNIRPAGLVPEEAVKRLMWLITESERLMLSGVRLKDKSNKDSAELVRKSNFLLE
jgi:ethanolamine ammonia-lyase small subunit